MRKIPIIFIIVALSLHLIPTQTRALSTANNKESVIIEVEGDPQKAKAYIEAYYPFIEIIAVYDQLFNGLALQAEHGRLAKMSTMDFVKAVHVVQTYSADSLEDKAYKKTLLALQSAQAEAVLPSTINNTKYTGKGIKIAVIDTGIDYNHPDLKTNYQGGYDLVDLDDDPMETLESEGSPTLHGTHVAGIIAGHGALQGVAPDAQLFSYRALGPGGFGSSIQVIAAMEQAVKDHVDIINLSLGNTVNGPDYPTSIAVNRASELGVAVVIANGNNGPENWTVGAPATAAKALAVGASANSQRIAYLYDHKQKKEIQFLPMVGSIPWQFERSNPISAAGNNLYGKIALVQRGKIPFYQLAKNARDEGAIAVLIYNNAEGVFQGSIDVGEEPLAIPVASITKADGEWLLRKSETKSYYIDTKYKEIDDGVADFSSRGPVTVNWDLKPDVLAPGTNIISTVPGGYQVLQGTSMAAPHVAGAIALIKQAHPNWSTEQIFGALKTTATQMEDEAGNAFAPIMQGTGQIQPKQAIETATIIDNPSLTFGKMTGYHQLNTIELTVENMTNQPQRYVFDIPNKQAGMSWKLPQAFTLQKKEKKKIPIELAITPSQLEKGIHQGWLTLNQNKHRYHLPYVFVNETADYPKAMGFEFTMKAYSDREYVYRLYVTDDVEQVDVELYDPDTLVYSRRLLRMKDVEVGLNEGYLRKTAIGEPGYYKALISVRLTDGSYENYETELFIDPLES